MLLNLKKTVRLIANFYRVIKPGAESESESQEAHGCTFSINTIGARTENLLGCGYSITSTSRYQSFIFFLLFIELKMMRRITDFSGI